MIEAAYSTIFALGDEPFQPGSPGGEMKCPVCSQNTPDSWQPLWVEVRGGGHTHGLRVEPPQPAVGSTVSSDFMYCANDDCKQLVVRVHENYHLPPHAVSDPAMLTETWYARPRAAARPIDRAIPEPFRADYIEAAAILDLSPRMSAVLSRRILADLLQKYANQGQFSLVSRIDKFAADKSHPGQLRENLHHFREVADFGAHTQTKKGEEGESQPADDQAQIINVGRPEAEWTLDLLDRLFEYFIITPERDRKMRAAMDERIKDAGRKTLPSAEQQPATEDEQGS